MDVVYALYRTQVATPDGGRQWVDVGQVWAAGDPVVRAAPEGLFTADPRRVARSTVPQPPVEPPVEQVTAGPGERRAQVRRGGPRG